MDKKGFELSIGMVVTIVLAIVFLGAAIFFINSIFQKMNNIPAIIDPNIIQFPPTLDKPLKLSVESVEVKRSDKKLFNLQILNYGEIDATCKLEIVPAGQEKDPTIKLIYYDATRPIPIGKVGQWDISVKTVASTKTGTYLYTINADCGEFKNDLDLMIDVQ